MYLAATGTVFRGFFDRSRWFTQAFQRGGFLVFSYLITNFTLNIDRLALEHMVGHLAVTQYYVTSLIGKTLVLLVAPVNTIIISYLTRKQERMDKKQFLLFTGIGTGVSLVFFLGAQIGTPIFVKLFYGDLYESVKGMITVVNLSQILGVLSAYLFIVVLTFIRGKVAVDPSDHTFGCDCSPCVDFYRKERYYGFCGSRAHCQCNTCGSSNPSWIMESRQWPKNRKNNDIDSTS